MRALCVLLTTMIAVPLLGYSASSLAIVWILRDIEWPVPRNEAPTLAHRGLGCVVPSQSRAAARQHRAAFSGRTLNRQLQELALSVWLQRRYDGDQLARLQGDTVWLGRGAFGLEAGARAWFDRPLSELTTAQAALLVALEPGPARFDPLKDTARAARRRQYVLGAWQTCGLIPPGSAVAMESTSVLDGVVPSPSRASPSIEEDD